MNIALVAHDNCKKDLVRWAREHVNELKGHRRIDALIFFWDPMLAQPHDVDVKALLRISNLYNIPTACNVATANCLVSSPAFLQEHPQSTYDFSEYTERSLS